MNTVYNASAGTGKTYQVTKYYIDQVIKNKTVKKDEQYFSMLFIVL